MIVKVCKARARARIDACGLTAKAATIYVPGHETFLGHSRTTASLYLSIDFFLMLMQSDVGSLVLFGAVTNHHFGSSMAETAPAAEQVSTNRDWLVGWSLVIFVWHSLPLEQ